MRRYFRLPPSLIMAVIGALAISALSSPLAAETDFVITPGRPAFAMVITMGPDHNLWFTENGGLKSERLMPTVLSPNIRFQEHRASSASPLVRMGISGSPTSSRASSDTSTAVARWLLIIFPSAAIRKVSSRLMASCGSLTTLSNHCIRWTASGLAASIRRAT